MELKKLNGNGIQVIERKRSMTDRWSYHKDNMSPTVIAITEKSQKLNKQQTKHRVIRVKLNKLNKTDIYLQAPSLIVAVGHQAIEIKANTNNHEYIKYFPSKMISFFKMGKIYACKKKKKTTYLLMQITLYFISSFL